MMHLYILLSVVITSCVYSIKARYIVGFRPHLINREDLEEQSWVAKTIRKVRGGGKPSFICLCEG